MKHEWRKAEKELYLPGKSPAVVQVQAMKFIVVEGEGDPNGPEFSEAIGVLYSLAYGLKMNLKKRESPPAGYADYAVYPLEGVWSLNDGARAGYDGTFDKSDLVYRLMIRQPDFISGEYCKEILALTKKKKPHPLLEKVIFEKSEEGLSVQMMHLGPYDDEPDSFARMEEFAAGEKLKRLTKNHREIYLSDFRKTAPEKLKTVLRFSVSPA